MFKRLIIILLGITSGTVLFFTAAEIVLRRQATYIISNKQDLKGLTASSPEFLIRYTPKGRRLKPNVDATIKNHFLSKEDVRIVTNSLGFRDNELSPTKEENEVRILVLGDSITWGDYLPREKVFVERLENYLNQKDRQHKFEAINAGVGDIGLREELDILEEKGIAAQPDMVLVAFYPNDGRPPFGFPGEIENRGVFRRHSLAVDKLLGFLELKKWWPYKHIDRNKWYKLRKTDWQNDKSEFMELVDYADFDWGSAWQDKTWIRIREEFVRLKDLSEKNNFKVVIVSFPVVFQIAALFNENTPQLKTAELAKEFGFGFLDLLPVLRKYKERNLYYDHAHPREFANDIIGREIAGYLLPYFISR